MSVTEDLEIRHYVAAVRAALADLPPRQADDLLEDLPAHLAEVRAETGEPLARRLGPPEVYAAELRTAVGLSSAGRVPLRARLDDVAHRLRARRADLDRRAGNLLGYERGSDFLTLLRPAWWVLRGYLAAMVFAVVAGGGGVDGLGLLPRVDGSLLLALFLLVAFVLGSIWLGGREEGLAHNPRRALRFATLVLVVWSVALLSLVDGRSMTDRMVDTYSTNYSGEPVQDIQDVYVYDRDGRLLTDVRLFDQDGRPIELGYDRCTSYPATEELPAPSEQGFYPLCPERAPFLWGRPSASASRSAGTPSPSAS